MKLIHIGLILPVLPNSTQSDWNIMSNSAMSTLAAQVPTSTKELAELGVLGENVVKEYGERLIKNINAFIQQEKLQKYLEHRKPKRTKSAKGSGKENSQNEYADSAGVDPFDVGIDFSTIELPSDNTRKGSKAKSAYWK